MKPGDKAVYSEDGGLHVVEVLENSSTQEESAFKLKVLGTLRSSRLHKDPEVGVEWNVWQSEGVAYAGMWHIRSFEEFAGDREDRWELLKPYEV